jgi:hypothetical protein
MARCATSSISISSRGIWFAKRGMFALSIALDDTDGDKLVDAVEEFAQTRAPLFDGIEAG